MEVTIEKPTTLQRYPAYKDSGVEWLGEIPEHWETLPIRAIFEERNEKNDGPKTDFILSVTKDRGVIPYDEKGAIGNNKSEDIERYKVVYEGDFVINKMNVVIGSLGMSKYFGAFSQVYLVYKPKSAKINIKYYSYIFSNPSFYKSLIRYCTGIMELRESLNKDDFKKIVATQTKELEQKFNTKLNVSYSYQHSATDTIAVDFENKPFRDHQNKLVFRPGGHGALIANLNALEDDIVFIKNIDNVSLGKIDDIVDQKKFLAGFLISLQKQIFSYLAALKKPLSAIKMIEIEKFATEQCHFVFDDSYETKKTNFKINYLQKQFNRPIRVCGMVKNEGEPGGGPFWVINQKNQVSLQIVESSQIDISNIDQLQILQQSTHFNPVDLVCGFRDFMGKKFDLTKFVDHDSGFIVQKNKNGCDLQGFELPGLWNGAMANWITIFVEVPLWTFNPVKTVNDLLKPSHQD